jgi:DNA-binding response OmpR family regulator
MAVAHENEASEGTSDGTETILLVEDNGPAREATAALLEMMGYRVFAAADGRAGLELFYRHADSIQLVLSDLIMPEMGGIELYRKIREVNAAIGLLMMTGYPLEDGSNILEEEGVIEWLQKPFTVKSLTAAVRRALQRVRKASEEAEEPDP